MIRDPSDGSVREPRKPEASGLAPVQDPKSIEEALRLEESRKWLRQYRKAVDDLNRMNDRGEIK